jgi:epoxyqueuosine reductase QueG
MSYRALDELANRLCRLLEATGHRAAPAYSCFPQKLRGSSCYGLVPLVVLGESAGIGRVARSGMLAHPEHGSRMLLAGVVTDAKLPQSDAMDFKPCPDDCSECHRACPASAIDTTGKVDHEKCIRAAHKNPTFWHLMKDEATLNKFDPETLLNTAGADDHASYECNACLRACPLGR